MSRLTSLLVAVAAWAIGALLPDVPRTPMVVRFSEHPFVRRGHAKVIAGGEGARDLFIGMVRRVARAVQRAADFPLVLTGYGARALRAGELAVGADPFAKERRDLDALLTELTAFQGKVADGHKPDQNEADAMDAKAEEAEALQKQIEAHDARMERIAERVKKGRAAAQPVLPNDNQPDHDDGTKGGRTKADPNGTVGYMRIGEYVVRSQGLQQFVEAGLPKTVVHLANVPKLLVAPGEREPLVAINREELERMKGQKSVPTIGTDPVVIEPTRVPGIVRVTEQDRLQLRDILNVSQTTSDAVKYTRIVSYTRAAATVARSAQKPEAALDIDAVTEAVRTIAVWIPVEEQQLSDYPALAGVINGELLYDVEKHVEELVLYGDGTGEDFLGILNDPDVLAARTEGGDTLIDIARRGITDVRRAGYEPNGILVDPLDWEDIVLEKGSDNRYVWVVVTEGATQRLWAVPVVETVAMEDFAGVATEERNMLVGDFRRGATLWDRQRSTISVGWINDQFVRNQRTILAELRAAFGVLRPGAFRYHETQAASAS